LQADHGIDGPVESGSGQPGNAGAVAAVPIVHEDRQHGVIVIYADRRNAFAGEERTVLSQLGEIAGLALTARKRGRRLEYERERLEFINRLIRHNLLNDLNTVRARCDLLRGHVEAEGTEHLEVLSERTDDMVDLIGELRSLLEIVVEEVDLELEVVDLAEVLRTEIEHARNATGDGTVRFQGDLEDVGPVLAGDLVGEVIENILTNAIRHNDADTPRVTVSTAPGPRTTAIHVADNGPGISEDQKERIFGKGEKHRQSSGSGFGLYLVREIVEAYDGTISVADNEPRGAVFTVEFKKPP